MHPFVFELAAAMLPFGSSITLPPLDLHASDFTVSTFVYVDNSRQRNIVLGNWSSKGKSWQLLYAINAGGQTTINLRRNMPTNGSEPSQDLVALVGHQQLSYGSWQHIAVTFSWGANRHSPRAILYVNGQVDGEASPQPQPVAGVRNTYSLQPSANRFLIGHKEDTQSGDSWFSGQLCNFHIYTRALSAQDIQEEIDSAPEQPAHCAMEGPERTRTQRPSGENPQELPD